MSRLAVFLLLLAAGSAGAIVIRDDVEDSGNKGDGGSYLKPKKGQVHLAPPQQGMARNKGDGGSYLSETTSAPAALKTVHHRCVIITPALWRSAI